MIFALSMHKNLPSPYPAYTLLAVHLKGIDTISIHPRSKELELELEKKIKDFIPVDNSTACG